MRGLPSNPIAQKEPEVRTSQLRKQEEKRARDWMTVFDRLEGRSDGR